MGSKSVVNPESASRSYLVRWTMCLIGIFLVTGCRLGRNDPYVQNALETFRIERDAAEDRYYEIKQKHDEAKWRIEDLEKQLKNQNDSETSTDDTSVEMLNQNIGSEYIEEYPADQVNSSIGFVEPQSTNVVGVEIDPNLSRGFDSQGKPGDDGILVVLRPVNETGDFVDTPAPVTISLIDPSQKGIRQRVGLWRFDTQQVSSRMDQSKQGYVFQLGWQRGAPKSSQLKLFARYQGPMGKLESEIDLDVVLDGQPRTRWTEVPSTRSMTTVEPSNVEVHSQPKQRAPIDAIRSSPSTPPAARIARPNWSPIR